MPAGDGWPSPWARFDVAGNGAVVLFDLGEFAEAIDRLLAGPGEFDLTLEAVAEFESSVIVGKMARFFSSLVP